MVVADVKIGPCVPTKIAVKYNTSACPNAVACFGHQLNNFDSYVRGTADWMPTPHAAPGARALKQFQRCYNSNSNVLFLFDLCLPVLALCMMVW